MIFFQFNLRYFFQRTINILNNLGLASLKYGNYQDAELAFKKVNIYEPNSAQIWGYIVLTSLRLQKEFQMVQALKQMFKCDCRDIFDTLVQLGDEIKNSDFENSQLCYEKAHQVAKTNEQRDKIQLNAQNIYYSVQQEEPNEQAPQEEEGVEVPLNQDELQPQQQ